jgi:hypothetical protein
MKSRTLEYCFAAFLVLVLFAAPVALLLTVVERMTR